MLLEFGFRQVGAKKSTRSNNENHLPNTDDTALLYSSGQLCGIQCTVLDLNGGLRAGEFEADVAGGSGACISRVDVTGSNIGVADAHGAKCFKKPEYSRLKPGSARFSRDKLIQTTHCLG